MHNQKVNNYILILFLHIKIITNFFFSIFILVKADPPEEFNRKLVISNQDDSYGYKLNNNVKKKNL